MMKKLLLMAAFVMAASMVNGQVHSVLQAKRMIAQDSLKIGNKWYKSSDLLTQAQQSTLYGKLAADNVWAKENRFRNLWIQDTGSQYFAKIIIEPNTISDEAVYRIEEAGGTFAMKDWVYDYLSSIGAGSNFANTNLTFTDSRIHDATEYGLTINNLYDFKVNAYSPSNWGQQMAYFRISMEEGNVLVNSDPLNNSVSQIYQTQFQTYINTSVVNSGDTGSTFILTKDYVKIESNGSDNIILKKNNPDLSLQNELVMDDSTTVISSRYISLSSFTPSTIYINNSTNSISLGTTDGGTGDDVEGILIKTDENFFKTIIIGSTGLSGCNTNIKVVDSIQTIYNTAVDFVFRNVNDTSIKHYLRPYKSYVAILNQTGTANPTVTVLENTLGTPITWTRTGTGSYQGLADFAVFASWDTKVFSSQISSSVNNILKHELADDTGLTSGFVQGWIADTERIIINTFDASTTLSDSKLELYTIEIRVYY